MLHRNIFDCLPQRGLPDRNRSDYKESSLYILRYWDTLVPSAGQCLGIFTARTFPEKKIILYGVLSVKNISDHSRVRVDFS